ncbi:hypothetical protein F511_44417 [Dorcoceras hygrometricum]|uniref:Uncharacterized protein n=1 Tax=Dorcoceras hygrometricum TaxID=472368 RepID=A0A2Z7D1V8_9LAMI|nr:hypothetical protein F511_44417 [Dorcoceras hygrometricum]
MNARGACALAAHGWRYAARFLARLLRIAARLLCAMDAVRLTLGGWPMAVLSHDDCAMLVAGSLRRCEPLLARWLRDVARDDERTPAAGGWSLADRCAPCDGARWRI